ncbi:beta-lactamase-like protein [Aspergillus bertholletiae]|uniref:Beta-lactamase-like protein n=1 Tax=Aspergillus bertholletiae TaxID=1226010 RepID=A0A5N7B6D9_9EURO|nr:beta-lactamase-like protein [Aspergillus bertholletiae]
MASTSYPPEDPTDYANASRGLIASLEPCVIYSDSDPTRVIWDNDSFNFLAEECPSDLVNPSLWRQSQLCQKQGLFEVQPGIYQVRGLDLSNITFVECPNTKGVAVIDPLTCVETARQALGLYQAQFPDRTIKALIYTHSHVDHFGGAQAIVDAAGKGLQVYAPNGFLEHAVSENVYAGNAMGRRAVYMYGESLPRQLDGQVGCGLGLTASTGLSGLIPPTTIINRTGEKIIVDGDLEIECQFTPGTEAPAEMNLYFPQYNALCMAENATHTLHNIQTLRGALVRDARVWAKYLDEAIVRYGKDSDVVFSSHHWPTWGKENVNDFLAKQRDLYAYMHNETLRLLNTGQTGIEIAEHFRLPPSLNSTWSARGYYGSLSHNVKAIYNRYMGWFDGNPAHLWEHPPVASAERYVKCMGGVQKVIDLAKQFTDEGDLRFAATLLNHAVYADQNNAQARSALASVYTKLGCGAENGTWRNFYLTGARELNPQNKPQGSQLANSAELLMALDLEQLFDTIAINVDGPKAWSQSFTIDFMIMDMSKGWHLNLSNGAVTGHEIEYRGPSNATDASFTIWLTHMDLASLIAGDRKNLDGLTTAGDVTCWETLASLLTAPDPAFAIVTPRAISG